jgi:hypothetical protein
MFPAIDRRPAPRSGISCDSVPRSSISRGPLPRSVGAGPDHPAGGILVGLGLRRAARPRRAARAGRALLALCSAATILIGCPLYSDSCDSRNDCASGFYCDQFSHDCEPMLDAISCIRPSQCEVGETCTPELVCRPGSCDFHGCVRGYRCGIVDFAHTCVPADDDTGSPDASTSPPPDAGELDAGAGDATPADAAIDGGP